MVADSQKRIRVLLADDHELVRAGFTALLRNQEGLEVVAEAKDGLEALRLIEEHQPDVVLMDVMMPAMNGLDVTARVTAAWPHVRVIILSVNASEPYVLKALQAGAAGYLLKDISPTELAAGIRAVASGEVHLTPAVAKHVVAGLLKGRDGPGGHARHLTPRQLEVLQLVALGNTSKQIAQKLSISLKTVDMHRSELMRVLDIHDIAGLVRYAISAGVIIPDR